MGISAPINPKSAKQMGKFPVSGSGGDDDSPTLRGDNYQGSANAISASPRPSSAIAPPTSMLGFKTRFTVKTGARQIIAETVAPKWDSTAATILWAGTMPARSPSPPVNKPAQ
jgi:hypothetical protein